MHISNRPVGGGYVRPQALSDVENTFMGNTERDEIGNAGLKMRHIRLVGPDALSGHSDVEAEVELAAGAFKRRIVDVAQGPDPGMSLQRLEAGMTVGIGWPLVGRSGKGLALRGSAATPNSAEMRSKQRRSTSG